MFRLGEKSPDFWRETGKRSRHVRHIMWRTAHQRERRETGMQRYDPLKAPDPEEWLSLDEQQRIDVVEEYHRLAGIRIPNAKIHAVTHAIIENQIAAGDKLPVRRTVQRLMAEGLDRHEAIHAVGMILLEFI